MLLVTVVSIIWSLNQYQVNTLGARITLLIVLLIENTILNGLFHEWVRYYRSYSWQSSASPLHMKIFNNDFNCSHAY